MNYKESKWAMKIIELQREDGSWGNFHSMAAPTSKQPITTEQALRRLEILGYTINDKPIKKAVKYLENCFTGKSINPDRVEKLHNWKIFTELIYSTWIRRFTLESKRANEVAKNWATIVNSAFENGKYDNEKYISSYEKILELKPKGGRLLDFNCFYQISLLTNCLDKKIESCYFNYILNHELGMYYIYDKEINKVPKAFKTKEASKYIYAIEILSEYKNKDCKNQLNHIINWLKDNMVGDNIWDLGKDLKDGVHFPLSDSWNKDEIRVNDCSYRINKLIKKMET